MLAGQYLCCRTTYILPGAFAKKCLKPDTRLRVVVLSSADSVRRCQQDAVYYHDMRRDGIMPDAVKKQTIKQAKASFKARGRPTLSEREARQLERAIELEQRAERAQEAEKRRAAAAKLRSEREKRAEIHRRQQQVQLGTQRRCDRFGYKSSQFHLGAFFGMESATNTTSTSTTKTTTTTSGQGGNDDRDGFGDDDLDDESLLGACDGPATVQTSVPAAQMSKPSAATLMPPPPLPGASVQTAKTKPARELEEDFGDLFDHLDSCSQIARSLGGPAVTCNEAAGCVQQPVQPATSIQIPLAPPSPRTAVRKAQVSPLLQAQDDLSDFFDDLESASQIARELDAGMREVRRASNASGSSFSSGSLELTEEDVEMMIDPKPPTSISRQATPKTTLTPRPSMLPPTLPTTRPQTRLVSSNPRVSSAIRKTKPAIRGPFLPASSLYCSPDLGFTSTQLESFIDDDLQLTQFG